MITFPTSFTFLSDEVSQDPVAVAAFAHRHGLSGIELRSMFGRQFREFTESDVREISRVMSDHGLAIYGCATPVFKCPLGDAAQLAEHRELFRRSVAVATALDCRLLRVFTFLRLGLPATDDALGRARDHVQALVALAPEGMRIGVENEASCLMGTGAETAQFLEGIDAPQAGVIWDPCNALYVPGYAGAATEGFAGIARRVIHIHAKDACRAPGGAVACRLGDGEVGWPRHLREIRASGYAARVSLETHWRSQPLDGAALHLPGGHGFSLGGEAASESCLTSIAGML